MRWSCGVFVGFVLALFLVAASYYYFYLRKNPEASVEKMRQVEEGWSKAKESGDQVIETIRPYAVPEGTSLPAQNSSTPANSAPQPGNQPPDVTPLPIK